MDLWILKINKFEVKIIGFQKWKIENFLGLCPHPNLEGLQRCPNPQLLSTIALYYLHLALAPLLEVYAWWEISPHMGSKSPPPPPPSLTKQSINQ